MANHSMDFGGVLKESYDAIENRIRVDAEISGAVELSLDAADDSVAIGDPDTGDTLAINEDGSIKTVQMFTLPYDAITVTYPSATQEIYRSRTGGIAGTVLQVVTVNYVDATKEQLLNVART